MSCLQRVLLCLQAFMCKSTTVLTPSSTSLTSPVPKAFCLSDFSAVIRRNAAFAGVRSRGNNRHHIFTVLEKTIIINYKSATRLLPRCAPLRCGCDKTNVRSLCTVMEYEQAALYFCFCWKMSSFLMKCRPF